MELRLYVDTCVWWCWLGWRSNTPRSWTPQQLQDLADFDQVFSHIDRGEHLGATFLHSELVLRELGPRWTQLFNELVNRHSVVVSIPKTRADGRYSYDGSIMHGGRMGGKLHPLLSLDGYEHDNRLTQAAATLPPSQNLYELSERKREFDIEHMEAALEANADLFITIDRSTILNRYRAVRERFQKNKEVSHAIDFSVTPGEALAKIS